MKLFSCDHCGNTVYFENAVCERCGHALGFEPNATAMISLEPDDAAFVSPAFPGKRYIYCANASHAACNWLLPEDDQGNGLCLACRHNETIPDLSDPLNLAHWQTIERAKKRLFYSLLRLKLPLRTRAEDPEHGLAFRFLAEGASPQRVMTGHESGIITIALAEADDAEREKRRTSMGEPYRTLLGHFRHEIAHHYWDLLVSDTEALNGCRARFGDDRLDYGQALEAHYQNGAPPGWYQTHISAYATAHPWEDFAETFAHFLHIIDTVEMAAAFGIRAQSSTMDPRLSVEALDFDPYRADSMEPIIDRWIPLALLLNNLNRAVGQPDAYPFILTPVVIEKLAFINTLVQTSAP